MSIEIREATLADWEAIADFNCKMAIETEEKQLPTETVNKGVQSVLSNPQYARYFLAIVDGNVVGQVMHTWEFSDWRNGLFWWLQSVYVLPEFRRQGIFRSLYQHVRQLADEDPQVVGIRLYVENENQQAILTYEGLGMTNSGYFVMEEMI